MSLSIKMKRSLWCWLALSPLVVVVLFPFAVMLFTALKPASEIFVYPARWLPVHWQWRNFIDMWEAANFGVALRNSTIISLLSTMLALAVSLPAAYALARFPLRKCCRRSCWWSVCSGSLR
jgi:multiple sugar transport system permease protein